MRIALCSYSQKEKETALLMKPGKVDRFDNGVFCTYAMQRDGPYDAVVVMEDGARGMNFCMSIRGYKRYFRCQPLRLYGRLQSLCSGHSDDNRMVAASPECLGKLVLIPQFVNRKLPIPIKKGAQPAFKPFHISQLRTEPRHSGEAGTMRLSSP